jgi:uncharacterized protein (DUF2336 family)
MIAERFLSFVETAPAAVRAHATELLARAYLVSSLDELQRAEFATALTAMLDDDAADVRRVMADALADSEHAPRAVIVGLAADRPEIAARILERSPLLTLAELIDAVGTGPEGMRIAVARRAGLAAPASAAVAAVGGFAAALALVENRSAEIPRFALEGLLERHGASAVFRKAMLERTDLPRIVAFLAQFAALRASCGPSDAGDDPRERLILDHAAACPDSELDDFVAELRRCGLLTGGAILRGLLEDRASFVSAAFGVLGRVPSSKAAMLLKGPGVWSLYRAARMPEGLRPVFAAALAVPRPADARGIAVVLAACAAAGVPDGHPAFRMLSRMHSDLAREAAREERRRLATALPAEPKAQDETHNTDPTFPRDEFATPEIPWTLEDPVILAPPNPANESFPILRDRAAAIFSAHGGASVAGEESEPAELASDASVRAA